MLFLTAHGGILGPIATLFGYLMNGIYLVLDKIGIGNIGLAIIIFTLITRLILYPFTVQQQKSSRLMTIIQPEIKAIQQKYQGKTDQASMMAQQAETKAVYEKYGTSMTGSCVQLLIQMPILFALYRVIMNVPAYVPAIKAKFMVIVDAMGGTSAINTLTSFCTEQEINLKRLAAQIPENFGMGGTYTADAQKNFIIDFLYKLNPQQMQALASKFPVEAQNVINTTMVEINKANSFLGLNLSTAPNVHGFFSPYILVPILAGLSQYLSVLIMQAQTKTKNNVNEEADTMQQTMKSMNIMMPLMSAVFCWGFPTGLGIYWIATSVFMVLTQLIVNAQLKNIDMDEMIKANIEKANKKRAKKGLPPINEAQAANNIRKMEEKEERIEQERERIITEQKSHIEDAEKFYFENENPDSLFAKANMVQKYNEKNNKK